MTSINQFHGNIINTKKGAIVRSNSKNLNFLGQLQ